ncbi:MAG: hypothetical protein V4538_00645 [Bacteroidota bacterium]
MHKTKKASIKLLKPLSVEDTGQKSNLETLLRDLNIINDSMHKVTNVI